MEAIFNNILEQLQSEDQHVSLGNMMRSPAIRYQSKVFAFYYQEQMVFKLDHAAPAGLTEYPGSEFLNPFKNKPPMKGWLVVPSTYQQNWPKLAQEAYLNIRSLTKK